MYPVYDQINKTLVFFSLKDEAKQNKIYLEKMGCRILEEIKLPFDFDFVFLRIGLPDGYKLGDSTDKILDFQDEKGRLRLRVLTGRICVPSVLFRRYYLTVDTATESMVIVDAEKMKYDDDSIPSDAVLVRGDEAGTDWLNTHYPQWSDPTAYWS